MSDEYLDLIDILSPNDTELERIIGELTIDEKVIREKLLTRHPKLKILLKLGKNGAAILTKDIHV